MAEEEDLTPDQTEKLLHFQDLTRIDDLDRCRVLLERHNWDIEVAVQDRLNEEEGAPLVYRQPARPEARPPAMNFHPSDQRIFTVATRRPHGILGWGYFVISFPFRFIYSTFMDILRFAYRLLRPDPRRYVTDPLGDVMSFIRNFEENYGPIHPVFYQGTYSQALNDAKKELKFLLVYLHGDNHQHTATFCRDTLTHPDTVEFINTRMLFWACNTNSPEGYRVSQALRENTYPFLAVIVLRENKMTVVARLEGNIRSDDLVRQLGRIMGDNETSLVAARLEREERSFNQSLRDEQDQAYLESLRQDQEKMKRKQEEEYKKQKEGEDAKQKVLDVQKKLEEITRKKNKIREQIPDEPDIGDPDAVRILLKLPSGDRVERRFLKNHSLKHLYNFVFCCEGAPDNFSVITNFPRKTVPCEPSSDDSDPQTFEEFGLGKSEMLFVHDNEA